MDNLRGWITRMSRLNTVALEARAAARKLTASEDVVLGALLMAGRPLNPSVLEGTVIQSPGGLTKTLQRLEEAGLIRRDRSPDDRRALLVVLTLDGERAAQHMLDDVDAHYDDLLSTLTDAESEQLSHLLRKVLDRLEATTGKPSSRTKFLQARRSRAGAGPV